MVRSQPLIAVTDVEASSRWYQQLLGCQSAHGGPEYERLVSNGTLVLQLHHFEEQHHHGAIGNKDDRPYGNGVLVWFEVDDFDAAYARMVDNGVRFVTVPRTEPFGKVAVFLDIAGNRWDLLGPRIGTPRAGADTTCERA